MKYYALLIPLIILCSCKNSPTPENSDQVINIPEDFVSFYEKFHSDSLFQIDHIVFPLSMKMDSSKWQKSEWTMHKTFDSQNGAYTREFDNFNGIIIENIREKNNAFILERRFAKFGGEYNLIYYTIINRLEKWGERILEDSEMTSEE